MRNLVYACLCLLIFTTPISAQMWNGTDTLYGNEWIDYDSDYLKFLVAEDGMYRVDYSVLENFLPIGVNADQLQLFYLGEEIPIYTSTNGSLGSGDYLTFYGRRNRSELDQYLYEDPADLLHPDYSLFTDSSAYFLTWSDNGNNLRFNTINNDLNNLPPKEEFFMYEAITNFVDDQLKKSISIGSANVQQSFFVEAEGYGTGYGGGVERTLEVEIDEIHTGGPNAEMTVRFACREGSHHQLVRVNDVQYVEDIFNNYQARTHTFAVPTSQLTSTTTVEFEGIFDSQDRQSVSFIRVNYPRTFSFSNQSNFSFTLPAASEKVYLEIENFELSGTPPVLYDLTNNLRIITDLDGDLVRVALPPSSAERSLVLVDPGAGIFETVNPEPITFIDYLNEDAQFIILYNQALAAGNTNWVEEYAAYRQNSTNNSFITTTVEVQQLYDQFGYGQNRHSISIRNFTHFIEKNWSDPRFLFIIGKGLHYRDIRDPEEVEQYNNTTFFVPTFGFPGSDNLLLSSNTSAHTLFPVGRLAAVSPEDVEIYLRKVQDFESVTDNLDQNLGDRSWLKEVMHLGGGGALNEQASIANHLKEMEEIIENNRFGGHVTSFYKTSSDPIETSQSQALKDRINAGISILTFFGHSSANTFDFNFDNPESYDNYQKYPLMFSMGCFSGQCHADGTSIGERFLLAEDRGAIAYYASTGYGFVSALQKFGDKYYGLLGGDMYGQSIGEIFREAILPFDNSAIIGEYELAQQTTLQGDPSLRLNPLPGPDYLIDPGSVQVEPSLLNLQLDSFALKFDIANIGYHLPDTNIYVQIDQEFPNGSRETLVEEAIPSPPFKESYTFTLPMFGQEAVGLNRFYIKVDSREEIEELPAGAELNNDLVSSNGQEGVEIYIVSNDLVPVFPQEFSIVTDSNIELKASTANAFSDPLTYLFEIDTTANFNSNLLLRTEQTQGSGVLKWKPSINWQDGTVYYWRVSPDSTAAEGYRWQTSSFIYLPNESEGWNQSHYFQYLKDDYVNLEVLPGTRKLEYTDDVIDIKVQNTILEFPARIPRYYRGSISQATYSSTLLTTNVPAGVLVAVLDTIDVLPYENDGNGTYGDDWEKQGYKGFLFKTDDVQERSELINFLENEIPDGEYVIFMTVQRNANEDYLPQDWGGDTATLGTSIYDVLEAQGAQQVRDLEQIGAVPYSLFYRKNNTSTPVQETIGDLENVTQQSSFINGNWFTGSMESTVIGPASKWESVQWQVSDFDPLSEKAYLNVYGIKADGTASQLHDALSSGDTSLAAINAATYPYLRLEFFTEDPVLKTSPHLDFWRVLFNGVPEAALNAHAYFEFQADTLDQGKPLVLDLAVENLSEYDMDSLLVHFSLVDAANSEMMIERRFKPLLAEDTLITHLSYDTRELSGLYKLVVDANPDFDQPEQTRINNVGVHYFYVREDARNPFLDVTFDGVHILDGDIVSPQPQIVVSLEDENPYLELGDTSLFRMLLVYPDGTQRNVFFEDEEVLFYPADAGNLDNKNKARIEFLPQLEQDGVYHLYIEAFDASGNSSGDVNYVVSGSEFGYDYKTSFRVINKSMISNILNYPNPFSTSTKFVYTLTGSEPPTFFKIQILSVSGRIVRELTQADLGPLRIGTHQTDFAWDGTDQFGDPLANGVYLYRVVARKADGSNFEQYGTGADSFFKKGFGKLVIIR